MRRVPSVACVLLLAWALAALASALEPVALSSRVELRLETSGSLAPEAPLASALTA